MSHKLATTASLAALIATAIFATPASAQSLFAFFAPPAQAQAEPAPQAADPAPADDTTDMDAAMPARLRRQVVDYPTREAPGTIIVDTPHTYLYLVLGGGKAMRYGIGVGREGFTWSGVKSITRKAEWPDWFPPKEMIGRQPYLPRVMAGGPGNPLGARALYIGGTEYRIHGTNAPSTIGKHVSSGCIRLRNADIIDLFSRVQVGAKVVVLPQTGTEMARAHTSIEVR
jgi:lipoprotein-anchoring transpeptidase ErfK/SrfK